MDINKALSIMERRLEKERSVMKKKKLPASQLEYIQAMAFAVGILKALCVWEKEDAKHSS